MKRFLRWLKESLLDLQDWLECQTIGRWNEHIEKRDLWRVYRAELADEEWLWDCMSEDMEVEYEEPSFKERQEHGDDDWTF